MIREIRLAVTLVAVLVIAAEQVHAGVIYSESVSGDLTSVPLSDVGILSAGTNLVMATASGSPALDNDYFQFTIPNGLEVSDISITATEQSGDFFNIAFELYAGAGFVGPSLGILGLAGSPSDTGNFSAPPLSPGTYTLNQYLISQNDVVDYAVSIEADNVSAVPEPTSLTLFGISACVAGVGAARRRQREQDQEATT